MRTVIFLCATALVSPCMHGQRGGVRTHNENARLLGQSIYASTCAGCHGLDGRGTERAPNIAGNSRVANFSESRIGGIISNGIAGTGMPAFHSFTSAQVHSVVTYLRTLQRKGDTRRSLGNPALGQSLFFGKGGCDSCHAVGGKGGFLGPDLTYDASISEESIRDEIVNPKRVVRLGYRRATLTTTAGDKVQGIVRNEDNFSVQLLDEEGIFHFFQKSELKNLEYVAESYMPTDYGTRLTPSEINDLVSFLMHSVDKNKTRNPQREIADE